MSNGLLFGLIAGLFGGSIWTLFALMVPDEDAVAFRWTMIGGAFAFWFFAGFLVGAMNAPRTADDITSPTWKKDSLLLKALTTASWLLYRLFVGWFVGAVAMAVFGLAGFTLWFLVARLILDLDKDQLSEPLARLLLGSVGTGLYSCFSGAVFGALFGSRWSSPHRPSISSRAVRSSFLSLLLGVLIGPSLGWLPPEETNVFVSLTISVPIGILGGILGGIWTDIRSIQRTERLTDLEGRLSRQHTVDDLTGTDG